MLDYAEKRDFQRMLIDSPARFRIAGAAESFSAIIKNLSSNGILMLFEREIDPGTRLAIKILPGKTITPPLSAEANVVRSHPAENGNFHIACQIQRILPESEVGADFP